MLRSARRHLRSVAMLGVAGALVVGGVAVAQNNGSGNGSKGDKAQNGQGKRQHGGPHGGPPGLGKEMKGLTYAEFHVQTKDGESKVIRLDQGKIAAVSNSSITVTENDGNEVTIAVDEDTKVMGKRGSATSLDDLKKGQMVTVSGPSGGTAKSIALMPKKGQKNGQKKGDRKGDRQGPPRSNRQG